MRTTSTTMLVLCACFAISGCGGASGGGGGGGGGLLVGGGGSADESCADAVYRYGTLTAGCGWGEQPTRADAVEVCGPGYAFGACTVDTSSAADCLENEGCNADACVGPLDALIACLQDEQQGCPWTGDGECDEPEGTNLCGEGTDVDDCAGGGAASCPWPNDGECDEPEGTNLCADGTDVADCGGGGGGGGSGGSACDPAYCSGSESDCTEFGCITCWYSCNGDTCDSQCSDPF